MNNTNYTKAHEAKNRGQHIQAAGYLKMAAIALGLDLVWTEDAIVDWEENVGVVDRWCSDSPWKLLHEEQPEDGENCYWGYLRRNGRITLGNHKWSENHEGWVGLGESVWGDVRPALIPINIYWCNSDNSFPSRQEAKVSLAALLIGGAS